MTRAPVVKTIRSGSLRIDVRKYADDRFGFDYVPPGEMRAKVRFFELSDAEQRARELLGAARGGKVERLAIDEDEYAEFLRWKAARAKGGLVPVLVESFLRTKTNKGRSIHHVRQLRCDLTSFAESFSGDIAQIQRASVEAWIDARNVGPRRWNNLRESLVALWRFARREGALDAKLSGAELIDRKDVAHRVETYTPDELTVIIDSVSDEWLPAIIFGAFCGLRPQEVCPEPRSGKQGLRWENVLWSKKKVDVPASVSKTRQRRFAPLTLPATAFLSPRRHHKGAVCPSLQLSKQTASWGKSIGGWRNDALRHSFASYRLALIPNLQALSLEMGNSPEMIRRHYLDLKHEDEAKEWFGIRPKRQPRNTLRFG